MKLCRKRKNKMTPEIRTSIKGVESEYKKTVFFFEKTLELGYSYDNRRGYSSLVKNGFRMQHWRQFVDTLKSSDEKFYNIFESIIKQKPNHQSTMMLLYLACILIHDIVSEYAYRQVKIHAKDGFLGNETFQRFTSEQKLNYFYSGVARHAKVRKIINDAIDKYWQERDDVIKVRKMLTGNMAIKYGECELVYKTSSLNKKLKHVFSNASSIKELIALIMTLKEPITEFVRLYGTSSLFIKLFECFNPDKLMRDYSRLLDNMIVENHPIQSEREALLKLFLYDVSVNSDFLYVSSLRPKLQLLAEEKIKKQLENRNAANRALLQRCPSTFRLGFKRYGMFQTFKYELSFAQLPIFLEWAEYMLSCKDTLITNGMAVKIIDHIVGKHHKKKGFCSKDIRKDDIIDFLESVPELTQGNASKSVRFIKNMIDFLIKKADDDRLPMMGKLPLPPKQNIAKALKVNSGNKGKNHRPIPNYIFDRIMLHIGELEAIERNAFVLSAETGMRPSEWAGVTPDCLIKENGKRYLKIWLYKQTKAYIKRGKKSIRKVPLSTMGEAVFHEQVQISSVARQASGSSSIFVKENPKGLKYGILQSKRLGSVINRLIRRHNICDETTGELWHYTPYQLRVSLVVEMIENGAADKQIKAMFGWLSENTMKRAYYMARKLKLMDMNTEFFQKEFQVMLTEEAINRYNEDELREIVTIFYSTSRKMAYGTCIRHPSQGICGKLNEATACAPCSNLKTVPENRSSWEQLYEDQFLKLMKLRKFYEERNHSYEMYKKYELYIVEHGKLESYANVLMNIKTSKGVL